MSGQLVCGGAPVEGGRGRDLLAGGLEVRVVGLHQSGREGRQAEEKAGGLRGEKTAAGLSINYVIYKLKRSKTTKGRIMC